MPSVLIEVRKQYSTEQEIALMEAVHVALQEAFRILPSDKNVRLLVHEPHRFAGPASRDKPEAITNISIDCFAGRSLDAKRNLYKFIVQKLEVFGIPPGNIKIILREISPENWGIRGGQAGCDVDLGYKVDV